MDHQPKFNQTPDPFDKSSYYEKLHQANHRINHQPINPPNRQRQHRRAFDKSEPQHKYPETLKLLPANTLRRVGAMALSAYLATTAITNLGDTPKADSSPIPTRNVEDIDHHILAAPERFTADTEIKYTIHPGSDGHFKSFMDYRAITDPTSPQFALLRSPNIVTSPQGLRCYMLDNQELPLVAVGSGVSETIGQRLNITIQTAPDQETTIQAVVGDLKANIHTDPATHTYHLVDKSVVEFLVDTPRLNQAEPLAAKMGNLSYTQNGQLNGVVARIDVLDDIVKY